MKTILIVLAFLTGCTTYQTAPDPTATPKSGATATPTQSIDTPSSKAALALLKNKCESCHTEGPRVSFAFLKDGVTNEAILDTGVVLPGDPDASLLYQRVIDNSMPLSNGLPASEKALLEKWINELGDAVSNTNIKGLLDGDIQGAIERHQDTLLDRDKADARYLSFAHMFRDVQMAQSSYDVYTKALGKLLNSLSWEEKIEQLKPIDDDGTIFYIDVSQFRNPAAFDKVESFFFSQNGKNLGFIEADAFITAASKPPLYHDLLDFPKTLPELEAQLDIDVTKNILDQNITRSGFRKSNVAFHNRVLERHDTQFGAYWRSYDFANDGATKNVMTLPLGPLKAFATQNQRINGKAFVEDGGEVIFHLPNGLQAYALIDGQNNIIEVAPKAVVQDPNIADRTVTNGVSCNTCHVGGFIDQTEETRALFPFQQDTTYPNTYLNEVLNVYPIKQTFKTFIDDDSARTIKALEATGNVATRRDTIIDAVNLFTQRQKELTIER